MYQELQQLAAQKLSREKPGQTLQATALVHEAYLRLVGSENQNWQGRTHFFAAAAEAMRRILIDNARRKQRIKRGGNHQKVDLEVDCLAIEGRSDDFDRDFNPLQDHNKERWLNIAAARRRGKALPPVELVQVEDIYFVLDGHHRISVAQAMGQQDIEAMVMVWRVTGPLPFPFHRATWGGMKNVFLWRKIS